MSATRPRPAIPRDLSPGTGKAVAKFPRHVSDEGRQRLSEIARERHRNGGFRPTGKPRRKPSKKRIAARVAKAACEKKMAEDIIQVFKDGIADTQPAHIRLKAAEALIRIDMEDSKLRIKEEDFESQKKDRDELLNILAEKLTSGHAAMLLQRRIESDVGDVIDTHITSEVGNVSNSRAERS